MLWEFAFFYNFGAAGPPLGAKWRSRGPKRNPKSTKNQSQNRCKNRWRKSLETCAKLDSKLKSKYIKNRSQNWSCREKVFFQKLLFFRRKTTHFEDSKAQFSIKIELKSMRNLSPKKWCKHGAKHDAKVMPKWCHSDAKVMPKSYHSDAKMMPTWCQSDAKMTLRWPCNDLKWH